MSQPANHDWWLVSSDERLRAQVGKHVEPSAVELQFVPDFAGAEQQLANSRPEGILLDLRDEFLTESVASLLQKLADSRCCSCHVIGIGTDGYHRAWAQHAYWAIDELFPYPGDLSDLGQIIAHRGINEPLTPMGEPREARSKTLSIRTYTPEMFQMLDELVTVAPHPVTLLFVGETGTGKSTLARLVHELSPRCDESFLSIPCGALPSELITSELFGHTRGAFTGADRDKMGKFEVADLGSILLDEIDVLDASQQATILRVIESGEYERLGDNETRHTGARIIAATNVQLTELVEQKLFRQDLYYRLNVMEFHIPPLRQRAMDIVPLTLGFVEDFAQSYDIDVSRIHPEFLSCIRRHNWPGNIRELKNHIRRAVLFCRHGELTPEHLSPGVRSVATTRHTQGSSTTLTEKVAENERAILIQALRENNFQRTVTAQALGISRVGLYKKMKKYGLLDLKPGDFNESLLADAQ